MCRTLGEGGLFAHVVEDPDAVQTQVGLVVEKDFDEEVVGRVLGLGTNRGGLPGLRIRRVRAAGARGEPRRAIVQEALTLPQRLGLARGSERRGARPTAIERGCEVGDKVTGVVGFDADNE